MSPVLEGIFPFRIERPEPPAADLKVRAGLIFVGISLLQVEDDLLQHFVPGLEQGGPNVGGPTPPSAIIDSKSARITVMPSDRAPRWPNATLTGPVG
jgi:hypothetical protein